MNRKKWRLIGTTVFKYKYEIRPYGPLFQKVYKRWIIRVTFPPSSSVHPSLQSDFQYDWTRSDLNRWDYPSDPPLRNWSTKLICSRNTLCFRPDGNWLKSMVIVDASLGAWHSHNYENEGWLYFFALGWGTPINLPESLSKAMNECTWNCSCKDGFWTRSPSIDTKIRNMVLIKCSTRGRLPNIPFHGVLKL